MTTAKIRRRTARSTSSRRVLVLPIALAAGLALFARIDAAQASASLRLAILAAAAAVVLFVVVVWTASRSRALRLEWAPRSQHYLQACAQATVMAYWGYYWRPVYDAVPLIAAQLVFAYAFDMLLAWARRDTYTLGFSPFPVIFSTNLFLWFKADWFFLQFLMIAVGFAAKELIRWEREGRLVHIFNPSSFPLAVFSLGLIATGTTDITWGEEIATTQFNPPNMYVLLFLVGLPGQFLFGVTTMTMSAVVTTYLIGLAFYGVTGTYFFIDSYIPIAVFLGMHLLFTDPSTSPRSEIGRLVFGALYGAANVVLYAAFGPLGIPKFYDKLLPVPLMNLSVRAIDRWAPVMLRAVDPGRLFPSPVGRPRHLIYMSIWVAAFVGMHAAGGVGDDHPGHFVPFWTQACAENRPGGCATLGLIARSYCSDGSGWACNEAGVLLTENRAGREGNAREAFDRGCALGFGPACANGDAVAAGRPVKRAPARLRDLPVVLRQGKGPIPDTTPFQMYTRACSQQWPEGCYGLGAFYMLGEAVPKDPVRAADLFRSACESGLGQACSDLGLMHYRGDGIARDEARGLDLLKRSCTLGFEDGCRWLAEQAGGQSTTATAPGA